MESDRIIELGFSRSKWKSTLGIPVPPFFSWLIMLVIWRPFSHAFFQWEAFIGHPEGSFTAAYEASGTAVKFLGPRAIKKKMIQTHKYQIPVSHEQYRLFIHKCMHMAGDPYGSKSAVGAGFSILAKRLGGKTKNPFADGGESWFCNELGGFLARDVLKLPITVNLENGGPEMLDDLFMGLSRSGKHGIERVDLT